MTYLVLLLISYNFSSDTKTGLSSLKLNTSSKKPHSEEVKQSTGYVEYVIKAY